LRFLEFGPRKQRQQRQRERQKRIVDRFQAQRGFGKTRLAYGFMICSCQGQRSEGSVEQSGRGPRPPPAEPTPLEPRPVIPLLFRLGRRRGQQGDRAAGFRDRKQPQRHRKNPNPIHRLLARKNRTDRHNILSRSSSPSRCGKPSCQLDFLDPGAAAPIGCEKRPLALHPSDALTGVQRVPTFMAPDGRMAALRAERGEESPGSTEVRCRVTPGGGNPRESATERTPPVRPRIPGGRQG
jgi:hypothetical protein